MAVEGLSSEELREAIASGRAQIKQGPTPDTIEISMPFDVTDEAGRQVGYRFSEARSVAVFLKFVNICKAPAYSRKETCWMLFISIKMLMYQVTKILNMFRSCYSDLRQLQEMT